MANIEYLSVALVLNFPWRAILKVWTVSRFPPVELIGGIKLYPVSGNVKLRLDTFKHTPDCCFAAPNRAPAATAFRDNS